MRAQWLFYGVTIAYSYVDVALGVACVVDVAAKVNTSSWHISYNICNALPGSAIIHRWKYFEIIHGLAPKMYRDTFDRTITVRALSRIKPKPNANWMVWFLVLHMWRVVGQGHRELITIPRKKNKTGHEEDSAEFQEISKGWTFHSCFVLTQRSS